jgi:hypothetical protein
LLDRKASAAKALVESKKGALMKILKWVVISVVVVIISLVLAAWLMGGWFFKLQDKLEPPQENMTFVGSDSAWYQYSKACQGTDGSIIIASTLSKNGRIRDDISILKLSPQGSFLWEKKFTFARTTIWDFIPAFIRRNKGHQYVQIAGISQSDNKFYILLTRRHDKLDEPFMLEINANGELVKSTPIKLNIENGASRQAFLQNDSAYLAYLDYKDKMVNLAKIDLKTSEIKLSAVLFFKQDSLLINDIIADPKDSTVSIIAYDNKKGCSFYRYTKQFDLKEYFRTAPGSEFTVLQYNENKLYGVIREDSLLEVIDLTVYDKPLIVVKDILLEEKFRPSGLLMHNGTYYVTLDEFGENIKTHGQDIDFRKYDGMGKLVFNATIGGWNYETCFGLFDGADSTIIVLGRSLDVKYNKGTRIFVSKFKM